MKPGECLEKLFHLMLIDQTEECPCHEHARKMDEWGPDKCRENLDTIIEWLREEAARRGMIFIERPARVAVLTCIRAARWTS